MTCPRYRHNTPDCDCEPSTMTPAEAVLFLRTWARGAHGDVDVAVAILIDHVGELERAIDLFRSGHDSVVRGLPANAVHQVPVMKVKKRKI